jgi:hypothetical protein
MVKRLIVVLLLVVLAVIYLVRSRSDMPFDIEAWRDAKFTQVVGKRDIHHEYSLRYLMVNDLINTGLNSAGMNRDGIRDLLGVPEIDETSTYSMSSGDHDAYIIRYYYNMIDFDTEYLILQYDSNGILVSTERRTIPG